MPTYIALLCAVNVGGTGKLSMADLRMLLGNLGYQNIETYIQSGNAVFDADQPEAAVTKALEAALARHMGAPVSIVVRTPAQLGRIIQANPFAAEAAADGARVHACFLSAKAGGGAKAALGEIVAKNPTRRDRFHLAGDTLYLHLPDGAGESKFTTKAIGKACGAAVTARNWNTVLKLHSMAER